MTYIDAVARQIEIALDASVRPSQNALELYRLYALLSLTTGKSTSLRNVHDAWSVWMTGINPDHDSLVPFDELPPDVKAEDRAYRDAIVQVAREARA